MRIRLRVPGRLPVRIVVAHQVFFTVAWLVLAWPAGAQHVHEQKAQPSTGTAWRWRFDGNVVFGWNYQYREFRDFQEFESQNWLMVDVGRQAGSGLFRVLTMVSLEPVTIQDLGSPQLFQTGETFEGVPLVDYQHPHDLIMNLGAAYSRRIGSYQAFFEADVVGSPSLGPVPFMHRPSAIENPSVPLSHHQTDSTHITPGVLRAGVSRNGIGLEGSWFRGLEPDENRFDLDLGALDSWAVRGTWTRGPWHAQVSGGHLNSPEWVEPLFDVTRLTASVAYTRADGRIASMLAWGQNREVHGVMDAYLFETTVRFRERNIGYVRAELVAKNILGASGRHPPGFQHFHQISRVGALTLGYVRDIISGPAGRLGVGGDATGYYVPEDLEINYGSPASFHVFLRYRPAGRVEHSH